MSAIRVSGRRCSDPCPMDPSWRRWALFSGVNGRPDPDAQVRMERAAHASVANLLGAPEVTWEIAADDESVLPVDPVTEVGLDAGTARHTHATFEVDGHVVHVDLVAARRSGPTFAFRLYRVFVDSVLSGGGGWQRCGLGAPMSNLPATGLIGDATAVTVSEDEKGLPVVKVWATRRC